MSNPRGGNRKGAGIKKPPERKYRRRIITLPPELDDRLINWSIQTDKDISPLIQSLLIEYFERIEK